MASIMSRDWALLPNDLLGLIRNQLVSDLSDYVRFSVVCKTWHSVTTQDQKLRLMKFYGNNQLPLLMIPTKDYSEERLGLYSVTEGKIDVFPLQVPYNKRCCGSSYGWIAIAEENLGVTLLNPFSNSRTFRLPTIKNANNLLEELNDSSDFKYEYHIRKVILSADPSLYPDDYVAVAIYGQYSELAFIKPGNESWTYIYDHYVPFTDAIYYKGELHVVDIHGVVYLIDETSNNSSAQLEEIALAPNLNFAETYIVESLEGDLFLAKRFRCHDEEMVLRTLKFQVFKLQIQEGRPPEWVKVKSIGDQSLFLGVNNSMAVLSSDYPKCQPNCIYFTEYSMNQDFYDRYGPCDIGVFNIEDGNVGAFCTFDTKQKHMSPAFWILPKLRGNLAYSPYA